MAPPEVSAARRAPRRPRSRRSTASRCRARRARPRRVAMPSDSMSTTRRSPRARAPRRARRGGTSSKSASSSRSSQAHDRHDLLGQDVERRVAQRERVELAAPRGAHQRRALDQLVAGEREEAALGGGAAAAWPERPMRCSAVAIERGEPIRQVRSTVPTSMPSSSEAVATTSAQLARLEALLGVEAARRATGCRGARRPRSSPSRSPRWRATRSTSRRVLTNTSVERCARASSASRS